jgi:hypothetical protein
VGARSDLRAKRHWSYDTPRDVRQARSIKSTDVLSRCDTSGTSASRGVLACLCDGPIARIRWSRKACARVRSGSRVSRSRALRQQGGCLAEPLVPALASRRPTGWWRGRWPSIGTGYAGQGPHRSTDLHERRADLVSLYITSISTSQLCLSHLYTFFVLISLHGTPHLHSLALIVTPTARSIITMPPFARADMSALLERGAEMAARHLNQLQSRSISVRVYIWGRWGD